MNTGKRYVFILFNSLKYDLLLVYLEFTGRRNFFAVVLRNEYVLQATTEQVYFVRRKQLECFHKTAAVKTVKYSPDLVIWSCKINHVEYKKVMKWGLIQYLISLVFGDVSCTFIQDGELFKKIYETFLFWKGFESFALARFQSDRNQLEYS